MENSNKNEHNALLLKCVMCGDSADLTAERREDGTPIWGLLDEGGIWGGVGPCGDWHRWVAKDDG